MRSIISTALVAALVAAGCGDLDPSPPGDQVDASVPETDATTLTCQQVSWLSQVTLTCEQFAPGGQTTPAGQCHPGLTERTDEGCLVSCPGMIAGPGDGVTMEADQASETLVLTDTTSGWGYRCHK